MKIIREIIVLFTLLGFSSVFGMELFTNKLDNQDMFENYLSNIHNQIRWSLYNHEPYKTMEGFYRWDESLGLLKGLPRFELHATHYKNFLLEREDEVKSLMAQNHVLKEYFILMTDSERNEMRAKAHEWVTSHFPTAFLEFEHERQQANKKSLLAFFKKLKPRKKIKK